MSNTATKDTSRHDFTQEFRELLDVAISEGIVDGVGLVALTVKHGGQEWDIAAELLEWAFASRHYARSQHQALCPKFDALCAAMRK